MKTLAYALSALDRPEVLHPAVVMLGRRHAAYGVTAAMAAPVGAALLDSLAAALGPDFTATARAAWSKAYAALAAMLAEGLALGPLPQAVAAE